MNEEKVVEISMKLDREYYQNTWKAIIKTGPFRRRWCLWFVAAGYWIVNGRKIATSIQNHDYHALIAAGIFILFIFSLSWITQFLMLRSVGKSQFTGKMIEFRLSELAIESKIENLTSSTMKWESLARTKVLENGLVLLTSSRSGFFLPKSAFASEDEFSRVCAWAKR